MGISKWEVFELCIADWRVNSDPKGKCIVIHEAAPHFKARWSTGHKPAQDSTDFWIDEATGEDNIQIFNFDWIDEPPDHEKFEDLMNRAACAIDEWITRRL